MAHLIWDNRLETGNPLIDSQHEQLHDLVMELSILAERDDDRLLLGDALFEILAYAATHFHAEEELMESVGYPGLDEQRRLHHEFALRLTEISKRFAECDPAINAGELWTELHEWLIHHVWEQDMKIAEFLRSRGN